MARETLQARVRALARRYDVIAIGAHRESPVFTHEHLGGASEPA